MDIIVEFNQAAFDHDIEKVVYIFHAMKLREKTKKMVGL